MRCMVGSLLIVFSAMCSGQFAGSIQGDSEAGIETWPYTMVRLQTFTYVHKDGSSTTGHTREVTMADDHGRILSLVVGVENNSVHAWEINHAADEDVYWDSAWHAVRVLPHPKPVEGRDSCWQPVNDPAANRDGVNMSWRVFTCVPSTGPHSHCEAPPNEQPSMKQTLADSCEMELRQKATNWTDVSFEDLGEKMIGNWNSQGCKISGLENKLHRSDEIWLANLDPKGDFEQTVLSTQADDVSWSPNNVNRTIFTKRLTEFSRNVPKPKDFQPPQDWPVIRLDLTEVSCWTR